METTTMQSNPNELWSGGESPFGSSYGKIMMWYFLISDTFTFAGLLISYGAIRTSHPAHDPTNPYSWPDPNEVFNGVPFLEAHAPLVFVTFMTFTLILSSVTMVRAVQEGHAMNRKGVLFWLGWTILGGLVFVGSQAFEWTHLIHEGMNLKGNPFGAQSFGQLFFVITGFHGLHVSVGVLLNTWAFSMVFLGVFERRGHYEMIEKLGLYWHFVDLVWVFVFLAFYLL
ncbi:MAG: cytochrome c oxidase subunit 3 [Chitinophagales bacterium]